MSSVTLGTSEAALMEAKPETRQRPRQPGNHGPRSAWRPRGLLHEAARPSEAHAAAAAQRGEAWVLGAPGGSRAAPQTGRQLRSRTRAGEEPRSRGNPQPCAARAPWVADAQS